MALRSFSEGGRFPPAFRASQDRSRVPVALSGPPFISAKQDGPPKLQRRRGALFYVYLIESISCPGERYVGITAELKRRLGEHNAGKSAHTAKFRPWRLTTYDAFSDEAKARAFERYLKSGSGHAFARKRLW